MGVCDMPALSFIAGGYANLPLPALFVANHRSLATIPHRVLCCAQHPPPTQRTPMTVADDTTSLQEQLAAHRERLATLLRQVAVHGADHAPPARTGDLLVALAEARREIARLKAALGAVGVAVEDQAGDEAAPDEEAEPAGAPACGVRQTIEGGDHNIQAVDSTVTATTIGRDQVAGDKIGGDKVMGDKHEHHHHPPLPCDGPPFSVPYPALTQPLVGHDNLLATLRAHFCDPAQVRLALAGMPGAGKTSLTLTLAYDTQIRQHFAGGVLMASLGQSADLASVTRRWSSDFNIQFDPRATFDEQLQRIAVQLNRAAQPYLIIIDDVWNISDARPFLLASPYASILFTGRQRDALHSVDLGDLVGPHNIITVPPLDEHQAVELLRQSAELPTPAHQPELEALAALVGGLPLLLDAMGRYLRDQRQQHQERWFDAALDDLQSTARRLNLPVTSITQARTNLRAGLLARFRHKPITSLNTRVVVALSVAALPRDVQAAFVRLAALPPDPLTFGADSARATAEATDDMLRLLVRRSLLVEAGDGRFRLHRVLWDWAENHDSHAVRQAQRLLADWHADLTKVDFAEEFGAWRLNPDNWQHMLQTWRMALEGPDALRGAIQTILPLLIDQGYARDVLPGLARALEMFRKVDRALTADIHYYLGLAHYWLAEYDRARENLSTALTGFQEGCSANGQAMVLNLLGVIESDSGHYDIARHYYEEAIDLTAETDERNYSACLNNLAGLLKHQGDYATARRLYERALAIREQVLGSQHPDTAVSLNNLASLMKAQGEYASAKLLHERALAICEQVLGPIHPDTATSLNCLAYLLQSQGDDTEAKPLYERALAIREQVLGLQHPDTATSLNNLASLLENQGDYAAARSLHERALAIREQVLGLQHPGTAASLNNLAHLLRSQGDDAGAKPLFERALAICEQVLGPIHPDTARTANNLAALLQSQGDDAGAKLLFERVIQIFEQTLGPQHPSTATSLNNLAVLLKSQGDYAAARSLIQRSLAICELRLGIDHPTTHSIRANLAALDAPPPSAEQ
jgi:tetratricopeptide (TPR) repeat protein